MDKELARKILNLLDSPDHVSTLQAYAEQEIQRCYTTLEGCLDVREMAQNQGMISALKRLKKLRDTAADVVKG
jgi:tellurite resistance protein